MPLVFKAIEVGLLILFIILQIFKISTGFQSFSNIFGKKRPPFIQAVKEEENKEEKRNEKMNLNFAEDSVTRKSAGAAPRLGVPSVYETKPWTFLQEEGEGGLTYQAAMALLEQSQAVIVDHRGFSPRMDVVGGGTGTTERDRRRKQTLTDKQKPTSWADLIRENIQRFKLF